MHTRRPFTAVVRGPLNHGVRLPLSRASWDIPTSITVHEHLVTPDIKSVISEITTMRSWAVGNPLCIIMTQVRTLQFRAVATSACRYTGELDARTGAQVSAPMEALDRELVRVRHGSASPP